MRFPASLAITVGASLALVACGGNPHLSNLPSSSSPRTKGPASDWPVKVGNPYNVLGQWYYPKDDADYDETGIASWYGPNFHGLSTANGEPYDMDMVSAAHKTLPLPSYVEVTNLDNGRRLVVRINDRGPFVGGRIIDLSRKSAELLGVARPGTARVRVRRVYPSEQVRLALRGGGRMAQVETASASAQIPAPARAAVAAPLLSSVPAASVSPSSATVARTDAEGVTMVALPASTAALPSAPIAPRAPAASFASPQSSFIQVAAVSDAGRASWLAGFLKAFGTPVMQPTAAGLIRVRIGPYASMEEAQAALAKVRDAGYQDARIVADGSAG